MARMGERRGVYRVLVGKPKGKRPLARPTRRWDDNIKMYVEIKCKLDATGIFIADLISCTTCFGHHYAHHQELKSIIQWLLPVVFRAVVFKLLVWCGAEGCVSGLQDAAA